jgi:hypothetical protein
MCRNIVATSKQTDKSTFLLDSIPNALYNAYKVSEVISTNSTLACNQDILHVIEVAADGYFKNANANKGLSFCRSSYNS